MHETFDGRQPQRDAAPRWDAWASRPPMGHLPPAEYQPPVEHRRPGQHRLAQDQPRERSRWHWLLLAAVVIPLLTPLYNRSNPQLWGLPFFYWCQMAFTGMAALVTTIIHLATRRRGR